MPGRAPAHPTPLILLCAAALAASGRTFPFHVSHPSEVVAGIDMRSPGSDWSKPGREAALATVNVDGKSAQHVMLWAGDRPYVYRVFLGRLDAGEHRLDIERNADYSARGSELAVTRIETSESGGEVIAHAPVLFARRNTVGKFTDAPLFAYCERVSEGGRPYLQYTVIFTNEDGGTPTRALMARWGRTTDIEYIYKAWLDGQGRVTRATIQSKDHKEIEFTGLRDGSHPLLMPSTDNNMVAPADDPTPIRYQLAPVLVDLSGASREKLMDEHPEFYRVMAQELEREDKLRRFGTVDGANISDPRNYLYLEAKVANSDSRVAALVRLDGERRWRAAHLGRTDYAIERGGWIRTTVELPPGTTPARIAEIGFECLVNPPEKGMPAPVAGVCRVDAVSKAFFLDTEYRPGASFWQMKQGAEIHTGEIATWSLKSK